MATNYFNITGVREGVNGPAVPLRQEIRALQSTNPDMFNLYILGLQRMQSLPKTDRLSWFQIAGIHGRPYTAWDSVRGNGNASGYCTHSSILFLTWHRPYLALYEQSLFENVKAAVAAFPPGPTKDKFTRLVPSFRMPYWDWAADARVPDVVLREQTIEVETATGRQRIRNPLYSYNFGSIDRREFPENRFNTWLNTVRYPNLANVAAQMRQIETFPNPGTNGLNLRDRVYALLSRNNYRNFAFFSNDGWNNNGHPDDYDSLESVHNTIHGTIGGGGHMSTPAYAGFDPIFWLHHTNVDRIFALWQVLNPSSYVVDQRARYSTFWSQANGTEGPNTTLLPFHQNQTTYWTSLTCRNLKIFGSTYPELVDWGVVSPDQVRLNVQRAVQTLYGRTAPVNRILGQAPGAIGASVLSFSQPGVAITASGSSIPQTDGPGDEETPAQSHGGQSEQQPIQSESTGHLDLIKDGAVHEYFCNVRADKYAAGGSFNVHIFLGDFSDDATRRAFDDNLVGTFSVFANDPETTGCEKCQDEAENGLIVTGSIPLTGALLDRIPELNSLEPDHVIPYLQSKLHWRCNRPDNTAIPREEISSLKVGVASVPVEVPTPDHLLPRYGEWQPQYEVTAGRKAGVAEGDNL
ncbi:Di-copper centre-containing protein [Tuber magnatum]|uniref:tyrosinase n=1 Tax=Tuber magnatum TaxID=42249 RepID=A0A317T4M7_9PEZI|nr:Di-copper centre-containing protein [Tuber magnatum]